MIQTFRTKAGESRTSKTQHTMRRAPTHPGEIFNEEFLKPKELKQRDVAKKMGISANRLNEIVLGKRGVTADTALRFAKLTGTAPEFWLNLQNAVDLYEAREAMAAAK
jgi:addiction module HigA family antidote